MSLQRDLLGLGLVLVYTTGAAWWIARSNSKLEERVESLAGAIVPTKPAIDRVHTPQLETEVLRAEIRRAFDEHTRKTNCSVLEPTKEQVSPGRQSIEPSPAPVGPEAIEAFEDANALLDRALAKHAWTDEDRSQLQGLTSQMDVQSRVDLVGRLVQSVNDGKLTTNGHIF